MIFIRKAVSYGDGLAITEDNQARQLRQGVPAIDEEPLEPGVRLVVNIPANEVHPSIIRRLEFLQDLDKQLARAAVGGTK